MAKPVPIGTRGEAETIVQFKNTLTAWKDHLPPVYSTPNMIGMMEAAAYNALEPFCEGDEVSVGTAINIVHRAPATEGMTIKTEAVLESFDGRFYTFKASASNGDRSDRIRHDRAGHRQQSEVRRKAAPESVGREVVGRKLRRTCLKMTAFDQKLGTRIARGPRIERYL